MFRTFPHAMTPKWLSHKILTDTDRSENFIASSGFIKIRKHKNTEFDTVKSLLDLSLIGKEKLITKIEISHSLAASALVVFIICKQKKPRVMCTSIFISSSFVKLQKILNSDLRKESDFKDE